MRAAVLVALSRIDSGAPTPPANPVLLRGLERETLTANLVDFIEPLLGLGALPTTAVDRRAV
jgi:hypothetical protein